MYDVGIIGGGVAGLSAGMYAGRMKLSTIILTELRGGTITTTNEIRNWPGISNIDGVEFAKKLEDHANEYDVEIKDTSVTEVKKKGDGFEIITPSASYEAKTLIIATGTDYRKLGIPGEKEYANKGVHYCALCDGYFYKDKVIAVIGGSDSAAKEALLLTQWAKKVYIIYRREKIRAEPINLEKVEKNDKIEVINNTNITEIKGNDDGVTNVVLDTPYNDSNELELDAVFVEIGRVSKSEIAKNLGVELNDKGEIKTDKGAKTNIEGIYAAGDVTDAEFKQAIISSAEGVLAAFSAYEYLEKKK